MRKITLLVALLALLAGCGKNIAPTPPAPTPLAEKDFTITANFTYDFTNFAACSTTVTTGCISGFQWGYMKSSVQVQLHSAATSVCTGATQPESCIDTTNSQLPMGSLIFYVDATIVDNNGLAGTTGAIFSSPVVVAAGTPSSLTVTLK